MHVPQQLPIALVGMACRLPGADDLTQYWRVIRDGQSLVQALPAERFPRDLYFDPRPGVRGRSYSDKGCLVNYQARGERFDALPAFIREHPEISFRTLCDVAASALTDAGIAIDGGVPQRGGVYVGHTRNSGLAGDIAYSTYIHQAAQLLRSIAPFQQLADRDQIIGELVDEVRREFPSRGADGGPELGAGLASALVARTFNIDGPCITFNSACASSLQALAHAARAIQTGRLKWALVGGASYLHHDTLVLFSQARSLSAHQSRPFDAAADGLIVGEGYAAVVIKSLAQALDDGDQIHAVIRGIGISSDGKGKSLWAPLKSGQVTAIRRAYAADVAPASIQYVEAHATSTQLGDATEVESLREALHVPADHRVALGSVKANIGHTLETAGLSGLIKTVLCLREQTIPAAINVQQLNPQIDWNKLPFYVPVRSEAWPPQASGIPRRAAVSAFGIGGLNAHVVLEEYQPAKVAARMTTTPIPRASITVTEPIDAIALVGRGVVLPGSSNVADFWQRLLSGTDPKTEISDARCPVETILPQHQRARRITKLAGQLSDFAYDWRKHKIPPKQIAQASPLQFMILEAVDQALREAKIDPGGSHRESIGVIVGTQFGGEFTNQLLMGLRLPELQRRLQRHLQRSGCSAAACGTISEQFTESLLRKWPALLDETGSFTSSSLASRVTKSFDVMGGAVAVDAGANSFAAALACCEDALLSRDCDVMICVGGYEDLSPCRLAHLALTRRLPQELPRAPFDESADGLAPGEGTAALLLMRLSDARREQRPVLAILRGTGAAAVVAGNHAAETAFQRAWQWSRRQAADINEQDVDRLEWSCGQPADCGRKLLRDVRQSYSVPSSRQPLSVDCLATQFGFLESASAGAALIKASLELQHQQAAATFGVSKVHPQFANDAALHTLDQPTPRSPRRPDGRLITAVHNCDDRSAYHILLERGEPVDARSHLPPSSDVHDQATAEMIDGIPVFDATRRRRESMIEKSQTAAMSATQVQPAISSLATAETHTNAQPSGDGRADGAVPAAAPRDQVEAFLIEYLVKKTGHPRDEVHADADLEADLGIDWLRKGELFAGISEQLQAPPLDQMPLDELVTVRDAVNYLAAHCADVRSASTSSATPSSMSTVRPHSVATGPSTPATTISADASCDSSMPSTTAGPPAVRKSADELQQILVSFVVEHTGYPAEFVTMDADLEADLGIDSIKKAMLFGELADQLQIAADNSLSLDDFPTLQHVLDYLVQHAGGGELAAPMAPAAPAAPPRIAAAEPVSLQTPPPPTPSQPTSPQAPLPATAHMATPPAKPAVSTPPPVASTAAAERRARLSRLIPEFSQVTQRLALLESAGLSMTYFSEHESITQDTTQVGGRRVVTFSSSNYLGMSGDPIVAEASKHAIDQFGTGVSASRLIAGKPIHRELEQQLARFLGAESTLVFSSGYTANETTIAHLFSKGDLILHDSLAHNCIIQGSLLSGARRLSFPHNNLDALERLLQENCHKHRRTLIAIEGAYSMDGDYPDLPRVLEIKRRYDCLLLVDDAHAIGTMGPCGRGIAEHFGIDAAEIDLWMGTLSKALGSCGGFVAGSKELIEYLKYSAPGFIYTVALSPASAAAALAALQLLEQQPERVRRLQSNAKFLLELAKSYGLDTGPAGDTPVVPILFGNSHTALLHSRRLLAQGFDIQPIVYPAVENEAARLRFMITALHTEDQIRAAVEAIVAQREEVAAESVPSEQWKSLLLPRSPNVAVAQPATDRPATEKPAAATPAPPATPIIAAPIESRGLVPSVTNAKYTTLPTDNGRRGETRPAVSSPAWNNEQLQKFLVNFVVEQTGYPPEMVEMDADLEADLGIDSIKKAQLVGELADHIEIKTDHQLTLEDFVTLRNIFDFIAKQMAARA